MRQPELHDPSGGATPVPPWQPVVLDPVEDAARLAELRTSAAFVHDTFDRQLRDLAAARVPQRRSSAGAVGIEIEALLDGRHAAESGRWVYFPWSRRLVHLLAPAQFRELRLDRNRHKVTASEQALLGTATIVIVGLSVGNAIALTLALEGVGGHLRLADFDELELSNMNRIRAGVHEIGLHKVVLAARQIAEIDPYLGLSIMPDGVTPENMDQFLLGGDELGGAADIVIDECDGLALKILLRERARELRLPVVMETSDRGTLDIERFDREPQRPLLHGRMDGLASGEVAALLAGPKDAASDKAASIVLQMFDADLLSTRMAASMVEMEATLSSWPQLASDVMLGGASVTAAVRALLLGHPLDSGRRHVDLLGDAPAPPSPPRPGPATLPALGSAHPDRSCDAPDEILRMVEHAVLAPSGANAQPWHFHWDGERLWVSLDAVRAASVLDSAGHGALMAVGAAVENAVIAGASGGIDAVVEPFPRGEANDVVAVLRPQPGDRATLAPLAGLLPLVGARRTDRRDGPRRDLSPDDLTALAAVAREHGSDVAFRTEAGELEELGRVVGASDRIRMLCAATNAELVAELRWPDAPGARLEDGITVTSAGLTAGELAAIRILTRTDVTAFLRRIAGGSRLEAGGRKLLRGASAAGLMTLSADTPAAWLAGGRAMQRVWLEATARGLSLQPLCVLLLQLETLDGPSAAIYTSAEASELRSLGERLHRVFGPPSGTPAMLFRLARLDGAPEPSRRLPAAWMLSAGRPSA